MYSNKLKPIIQYWCPNCDALLNKYDKYCHNCGKPLNWDDIQEDEKLNFNKKDNINIEKIITINPFDSTPEVCRNCPTHPSNGGSGICNCTLGLPKITC